MFRTKAAQLRTLHCMTAIGLVLVGSSAASAQDARTDAAAVQEGPESQSGQASEPEQKDIIITGSRIRRSIDEATEAPVAVLNADTFKNRGFTQVGEALNELTSNTPQRNAAPYVSNGQAVAGADFPNLFNLGPARTLTLLNGRRMVSTSLGLGDQAVDTNVIPLGLLDRVEIVQGGGAAVYGSGAIGGVVNYILKKNASGVRADAQQTITDAGDSHVSSFRLAAGRNFADGRGNIAAEIDYSKVDPLLFYQRADRYISGAGLNTALGAGANGIPYAVSYNDSHQYVDADGLVVLAPGAFDANGVLQIGGRGLTIGNEGNLQSVGLGTPIPGIPYTTTGSELTWPFRDNQTFQAGVERIVGTIIGHYDLTSNLTFSSELLFARTRSRLVKRAALTQQYIPVLAYSYLDLAPLEFTRNNPYLSAASIQTLSTANPGFAAGQPLYLSKNFYNIDPNGGDQFFTTTTYRAQASLDGNFYLGKRRFDYQLSYSHGEVDTDVDAYAAIYPNFRNAANAVRNAAGQIVCAINQTTVTDAKCVPFNIFGQGRPSAEVLSYIVGKSGVTDSGTLGPVKNLQDDVLATINGDVAKLPGGIAKFSASYEHRDERSSFNPLQGDLDGLYLGHLKAVAGRGGYHTNEFAGELDIPLLGGDFRLPLVQALGVNGSYRYVDNSIAGGNSVWGLGARWLLGEGLTLRGSRSRNFRAPGINQVNAPASTTISAATSPCSRNLISAGSNPAARAQNCLALFSANATYGLNNLPAGVANTPANRLANFLGTSTSQVQLTVAGNPDLKNEVSNTLTYGFVFQPRFIPGLTITADRLDLKIGNALALFGVNEFASTCFDASPQPAAYCSTFTFDANGDIKTGISTTVNAGLARLKSDMFNIDYRTELSRISQSLPGTLNIAVSATHNRLEEVVFNGNVQRLDGTVSLPEWSGHFEARYKVGPVLVAYALNYLSPSLLYQGATVENATDGLYKVRGNYRHDISFEIEAAKRFAFRFGVNDVFDRKNEYPVFNFGDIIGWRFFAGVTTQF